MPQSQFNNADAVVLDQNQPNWLQGFVAGRNAGQPNYKLLSYDLQRQRLAEQEQRQQDTDFQKAYNQLWNTDKSLKPGGYSDQIQKTADDNLKLLTQMYLSENKDPNLARQMAGELLSMIQKNSDIEAAIKAYSDGAMADARRGDLNYDVFTSMVGNILKNTKLSDVNVDDFRGTNFLKLLRKQPQYGDLYNLPNIVKGVLKEYGVTKTSDAITNGNALSSSAHKAAVTLSNAFTQDPVTGEYIPKSDVINLDQDAHDFVSQVVGETGKSARGVSDEIYNYTLQVRPHAAEAMGSKIDSYNIRNGLKPGDKDYINPNSEEGENIKKVMLYHYYNLAASISKNTSTAHKQTLLGGILSGNPQIVEALRKRADIQASIKAGTDPIVNTWDRIIGDVTSGDADKMSQVPGVEVSNVPGMYNSDGTPVQQFDFTQTFQNLSAQKTQTGKKIPYARVIKLSNQPGTLYVQENNVVRDPITGAQQLEAGDTKKISGVDQIRQWKDNLYQNSYGTTVERHELQKREQSKPNLLQRGARAIKNAVTKNIPWNN